jgi:hypothetical protein
MWLNVMEYDNVDWVNVAVKSKIWQTLFDMGTEIRVPFLAALHYTVLTACLAKVSDCKLQKENSILWS